MKMCKLSSVSKTSIAALLLLSVTYTADAMTDSMKACASEQQTLFENNELDKAFEGLLRSYNETCNDEGLCTYQIDDDTMTGLSRMKGAGAPAPEDIPSIKGSGSANFGGLFFDHISYSTFRTACNDAGGAVVCVDSQLTLDGTAGEAFMNGADGILTDVKIKLTNFPICMTSACENEDITAVLETTGKNAILKSDQVAEDLDSKTESLIQAATIKQICALSGLGTCELDVEKKQCSSASNVGVGIVAFLALGLTVLYDIV